MKCTRTSCRFVTVIRVFFEFFCLTTLIISAVSLLISIEYCYNYRTIFNVPGIKSENEADLNWAMFPLLLFYFFNLLATVVTFFGFVGAVIKSQGLLTVYMFLTTAVLLFAAIFIFLTFVFYQTMQETIGKMFKSYTDSFYGMEEMRFSAILDPVINALHRYHQCCGYFENVASTTTTSQLYSSILYWTETTTWGQIQWEKRKFRSLAVGPYVPESCCRKLSEKTCSEGIFKDRLNWNQTKEQYWKTRIFGSSCSKQILCLSDLSGSEKTALFLFIFLIFLFLIMTILIALELRLSFNLAENQDCVVSLLYSRANSNQRIGMKIPGKQGIHRAADEGGEGQILSRKSEGSKRFSRRKSSATMDQSGPSEQQQIQTISKKFDSDTDDSSDSLCPEKITVSVSFNNSYSVKL